MEGDDNDLTTPLKAFASGAGEGDNDDLQTQAASPAIKTKPEMWARWPMLVLICLMMMGDFYCYDNPAALKEQLKTKFADKFTPSQYETNFQLLYSAYAFPNVILPFFGGYLVDRFGTRVTMLAFSATLAVAQCVVAFGSTKCLML